MVQPRSDPGFPEEDSTQILTDHQTMAEDFFTLGNWVEAGQLKTRTWKVSERFGTGRMKQIEIRPGLMVLFHEMVFESSLKTQSLVGFDFVCFYFCLAGNSITHVTGARDKIVAQKGVHGVTIGRRGLLTLDEFHKNDPCLQLTIRLSPDLIMDMLKGEEEILPGFLKQIAQGNLPDFHDYSVPANTQIQSVLSQLVRYMIAEQPNRLKLEGLILYLLANAIDAFRDDDRKKQISNAHLNARDTDRIHYACDLLARDLVDPPSLSDLALAVGLNRFKLNRGFKQVFGNTVFTKLQEIRLETAKQLLIRGDMNVSEVSNAVGYSNLSHFAKSFKQRYRVSPKSYLQ